MPLTAALLTSTPVLARHISRILTCSGVEPRVVGDVNAMSSAIADGCNLALFGAESLDAVVPALKGAPGARALIWSGEEAGATVAAAAAVRQIDNVFGLRYPSAPPRNWELLQVLRRMGGAPPPSIDAYLDWGASLYRRSPTSSAELDQVVNEVEQLAGGTGGRRLGSSMAEVAHELLMNAMYDAPVGPTGEPLFRFRRNEAIELNSQQRPDIHFGCDGSRFVLSVTDPFGGLRREHVFGGISRALSRATLDRSGGGAGLGLTVIFKATTMLFFDVIRGYRTRATAVLELDVPQRELRTLPRSIHFIEQEPDDG